MCHVTSLAPAGPLVNPKLKYLTLPKNQDTASPLGVVRLGCALHQKDRPIPSRRRSRPGAGACALHHAGRYAGHFEVRRGGAEPGAIAVDYALSSPNVSAVRTNVGRYTISFPAGGGPPSPALGWTECGLLNPTVQGQLLWMWSANPQDFEGGHVGIRFLNAAGSGADLVGRATVNVFCLCDHTNN